MVGSTTSESSQALVKSGTITFLFSDIEGSTQLLHQLGDAYAGVLEEHRRLLRAAFAQYQGREIDTAGDSFFVAFDSAPAALAAAVAAQRSLFSHQWPQNKPVRVRMGIHSGEAQTVAFGYVGLEVHRAARICAVASGGQILLSESAKALAADKLPPGGAVRELGSHSLKDFPQQVQLYQLSIDGLPQDFPSLKTTFHRPGNLPSMLPHLFGRDKDLEAICNLFQQEKVRLITLTGPGGIGKTALGLQVASSLRDRFADGVFVVFLASVRESSLVAAHILLSLGTAETPGTSATESLKRYLSTKRMLLFLDNFEQLVDAAPLLSELLAACPHLRLLVSSRSVLRIRLEQEYSLDPLALPRLDHRSLQDAPMASNAAVLLFAERAKAVKPSFSLDGENERIVAELCVQLEGLPLAIELASARIKVFTPQMLLNRMQHRLHILKGGGPDLPERHHTIRDTIAWSYDLLSAHEKRLFRCLSVFVGGFSLEAVEHVCKALSDEPLEPLDTLIALMDKSLIRRDDKGSDEARFYMLEVIREFAQECLHEQGEGAEVRRAHAEFYLQMARQAEPHLTGAQMLKWMQRLDLEEGNLWQVLQWAKTAQETELALSFCAAIWRYWLMRHDLETSFLHVQEVLALPAVPALNRLRAVVLNAAGTFMHELSDFVKAMPLLEESLSLFRMLEDKAGMALVLNNLTWVAIQVGEFAQAQVLLEESRQLNTALKDTRGLALVLNNEGWMSFCMGDFERGSTLLQESTALRQSLGDQRGVAFGFTNSAWIKAMQGKHEEAEVLLEKAFEGLRMIKDRQLMAWALSHKAFLEHNQGNFGQACKIQENSLNLMGKVGNKWAVAYEIGFMGHLKHDLGELEEARSLLEESLSLFRDRGSRWAMARTLYYLGRVHTALADFGKAKQLYKESLQLRQYLQDSYGIGQSLAGFGSLAYLEGEKGLSAALYGAAENLRQQNGSPWLYCEHHPINKNLASLKEELGESAFASVNKLSTEAAIRLALKHL